MPQFHSYSNVAQKFEQTPGGNKIRTYEDKPVKLEKVRHHTDHKKNIRQHSDIRQQQSRQSEIGSACST
eukprot:UN25670